MILLLWSGARRFAGNRILEGAARGEERRLDVSGEGCAGDAQQRWGQRRKAAADYSVRLRLRRDTTVYTT